MPVSPCTKLIEEGKLTNKPEVFNQRIKCEARSPLKMMQATAEALAKKENLKLLNAIKEKRIERLKKNHIAKLTEEQKDQLVEMTLKALPTTRLYLALMHRPKILHTPSAGRTVRPEDFEISDQKIGTANESLTEEDRKNTTMVLRNYLREGFNQNATFNEIVPQIKMVAQSRLASMLKANPLLYKINSAYASRAEVRKAVDELSQSFDKQIADLEKQNYDKYLPDDPGAIMMSYPQETKEVLQERPELCWSSLDIAYQYMNSIKRQVQAEDLATAGGGLGCLATGPYIPICELSVAGAANAFIWYRKSERIAKQNQIWEAEPYSFEQRKEFGSYLQDLNFYPYDPYNYTAFIPSTGLGVAAIRGTKLATALSRATTSAEKFGTEKIVTAAVVDSSIATRLSGRCVAPEGVNCLDVIQFGENTFSKVSVHSGWTPEQISYLKKSLEEIQQTKVVAENSGKKVSKEDLKKWFEKESTDPKQPFRMKHSSLFPENVTPVEIARDLASGKGELKRVIPQKKSISPENHLYNLERTDNGKKVTYQILTCAQSTGCTAAGRKFKYGEVTSIFPCGPNVRTIPDYYKATRMILQAKTPLKMEDLVKVGSECIH